jgi:hypothetical protein
MMLSALPVARKERLVIQLLPDQSLVYDETAHKTHWLSPTTSLVWQLCDGNTKVSDMPLVLMREKNVSVNTADVCLALGDLAKLRLLQ